MECHIEQVLYRDQRTIKTRYFDPSESHHQPSRCPRQHSHIKPSLLSEPQRFHLYLPSNHQDGAFSIHGAHSTCSLDNCHNQYFLKFKRLLYRTDVECECEDDSFSRISERRKRGGTTTWFKKLQNLLLLSTYLSILTLPNTYALPVEMCSRPNDTAPGFWVKPCAPKFVASGEPLSEMNVTSIKNTINSSNSALIPARYLKEEFQTQTINNMGSDPEALDSLPNYSWLPQLPKLSSGEAFSEHLSSLQWQEIILTIFKHLQTIAVPLEQLTIDYTNDSLGDSFRKMEGLVLNVLCDLHDSIIDNNLKVEEDVSRNIMPSDLRQVCNNKTERIIRDSIILRELVNILEYTLGVCKYLASERNGGKTA